MFLIAQTTMHILFKKLVFQISFLLQTTIAFSGGGDEKTGGRNIYRIELEKTFGHNFLNLIQLKDVLVWKILVGQKTFKPQDYSNGFKEFETKETFLIFTQNRKFHFTLYYWVGTETTLEDKIYIAQYAMFFMLMVINSSPDNVVLKFTREEEIFESESFIHTLNRLRSKPRPVDGRTEINRDGHFPLNGPNLYIVTKNRTRSIIKIPVGLGLKLLIHDICLVVDILPHINEMYPASTYCVYGTNNFVQWRAQSLVKHFRNKLAIPEIITRGSNKYKIFIELLEIKEYYRTSETDYLQDSNKIISDEAEEILLFKLTLANIEGEKMECRETVTMNNVNITRIDVGSNYMLDTKSVAGMYFVYGNMVDSNEIIWAIGHAEEYLHDEILSQGRPIRMRITSTVSTIYPTDFQINSIPPSESDEFYRMIRQAAGGHFL